MTEDAALMEAVATGDRPARDAAFRELVARHRDRVHGVCYRYFRDPVDAEDATQETFLTVLRRAGTFRGDAQVSTWLYRVATNTCHDIARKRARRPQTPVEDVGTVSDLRDAHSDDATHEAMALTDALRDALATLDEETRSLLLLCVVEEVPYAEVAATFGIAVGTVKSRVHRARARLAEQLGDLLDEDAAPTAPAAGHAVEDPPEQRTRPPSVRGPPEA